MQEVQKTWKEFVYQLKEGIGVRRLGSNSKGQDKHPLIIPEYLNIDKQRQRMSVEPGKPIYIPWALLKYKKFIKNCRPNADGSPSQQDICMDILNRAEDAWERGQYDTDD